MLQYNKEYKKNAISEVIEIPILSNIIVNQICPFLEYNLHNFDINARALTGNYDNIMQDSNEFKSYPIVFVFWELCNIIDGLQYKAAVLTEAETDALIIKVKSEIDFVYSSFKSSKQVIWNKFSSLVFNFHYLKNNNLDFICSELNSYLESKSQSNILLIDIDKVLAKVGIEKAVDFRNFYSSKALYSTEFYKAYVNFVQPIIFSITGRAKKAIVFDCDNTLWSGILGEDGEAGIEMSSDSKRGVCFEEVQFLAKSLANNGVILGLNSKNNESDVNNVLKSHKKLSLSETDIVIKKINWNDKVSNLKEIASQLNIGIDSIVFVDDSDFEVNLVKEYLPIVHTIQVPAQLYSYPSKLRASMDLFYNVNNTVDDNIRIKSYQSEAQRQVHKSDFSSIEDYLVSLNLEIVISVNNASVIDRMAQLTQKTNQFNLTTIRYTSSEVEVFVKSEDYLTIAFEVNDRFGNFGIVGTSIIKLQTDTATIDIFLMSCRVLGRNIEFSVIDEIIKYLKNLGLKSVKASYVETGKNHQVKDFYLKAGFSVTKQIAKLTEYSLDLPSYVDKSINYIRIKK